MVVMVVQKEEGVAQTIPITRSQTRQQRMQQHNNDHPLLNAFPPQPPTHRRVAVFYVSLSEGTVKRGDMACDTAPNEESRLQGFRVVKIGV